MNCHEYASFLFAKAKTLGLEAPTESMIAEALHNNECNTRDECCQVLIANGMPDAAKEIQDHQKRLETEDYE